MPKARLLAFYLPQFHPVPENDLWWGAGFTEWTNVSKARPLFRGHLQPKLPADLGFYDLRVPEVRDAQATLARAYGVEGFCYWHYWFGNGRRLLERPFSEVLRTGQPNFPFCLAWANESWTGVWHGAPQKVLVEQLYGGVKDYQEHFHALLPAFLDNRYLQVDGKNIFVIYRPMQIPVCREFIEQWRRMAVAEGAPDFHFIGVGGPFPDLAGLGLDGWIVDAPKRQFDLYLDDMNWSERLRRRIALLTKAQSGKSPVICDYRKVSGKFDYAATLDDQYPLVLPNWDNTPRAGRNGYVLENTRPEYFERNLSDAIVAIESRNPNRRLIFLKSWNEWAEGNYVEPCAVNEHEYLRAVRRALFPDSTQ